MINSALTLVVLHQVSQLSMVLLNAMARNVPRAELAVLSDGCSLTNHTQQLKFVAGVYSRETFDWKRPA